MIWDSKLKNRRGGNYQLRRLCPRKTSVARLAWCLRTIEWHFSVSQLRQSLAGAASAVLGTVAMPFAVASGAARGACQGIANPIKSNGKAIEGDGPEGLESEEATHGDACCRGVGQVSGGVGSERWEVGSGRWEVRGGKSEMVRDQRGEG